MVWLKVDDRFYTNKKVLRIPRARRLTTVGAWLLAATWAAAHDTSGTVPDYVLDELGIVPAMADELVRVELWERTTYRGDEAIVFHDWEDYQVPRDVAATREYWAEKKREQRVRDKSETQVKDERGRQNTPTRPDPTKEKTSSSLARTPETSIPEGWMPTASHRQRAQDRRVSLDWQADRFRAHAEMHDRRVRNWNRAFTEWLDKADPAKEPKATPSAPAEPFVPKPWKPKALDE